MAKGLKNIIHNCKEATQLVLKKEEQSLRFRERMQLRIHLLFCDACKQFVKQSSLINKAFQNLRRDMLEAPEQELSSSAKERIKARLQQLK